MREKTNNRYLKVLHVNYGLERGGIETWLRQLADRFPRGEVGFSLAYHRGGSDSMANDLRSAGFTLFELPSPRNPYHYLKAYRGLLRGAGPFDAVHSHVNFAGLLMLGAHLEHVPARIAHSHVSPALMTRGLVGGGYARLTNQLFLQHMTHGIAVSEQAAPTLFGSRWRNILNITVEPCGIDLSPYREPMDARLREQFGIPVRVPVIATIGRLSREKNQAFVVQIANELDRRQQDFRLLLVGDGPQRSALTSQIETLGLAHKVTLLGERRDVPALLGSVIDLLLAPSLTEGAPLTVIEAQAAGVPCVVSEAIPAASIVAKDSIQVLAFSSGVQHWADQVQQQITAPRRHKPCRLLDDSPFDIAHNARVLQSCYRATGTPV